MSAYASYKSLGHQESAPLPVSTIEVVKVLNKEHRQNVINSNNVVIIDNFTEWCGPCKEIAPKLDMLAEKYKGKCFFLKEDADDEFEDSPPVNGVPCFHFYVGGNFVDDLTVIGANLDAVEKNLESILTKLAEYQQHKNRSQNQGAGNPQQQHPQQQHPQQQHPQQQHPQQHPRQYPQQQQRPPQQHLRQHSQHQHPQQYQRPQQ